MLSEPLRFIHASRLMLDHQLRGIGNLPAEFQSLVEDATLIAFNRVIDAALAHNVDFLLVVGDSFERHDRGLRGQAALARGLARLEEREIPAFVTSGRRDPWSAWLPGLRFTENVHRLDPNAVPRTFQKHGRVLARIAAYDTGTNGETGSTNPGGGRAAKDESACSMALVYWDDALRLRTADERQKAIQDWFAAHQRMWVDYWAFGGSAGQQAWTIEPGIAHDPGGPQGLRPSEAGLHGCTLWELDGRGPARSTFLPTSPVRFESRHLSVPPHWQKDDLLHAMREGLRSFQRHDGDLVWSLTWRFHGEGPLFETLSSPSFHGEVVEALRGDEPPGVAVAHDFRVPVYVPQSLVEGDRFSSEFAQTLGQSADRSSAVLLAQSSARGTAWESRLAALLIEIEDREIATNARGAGLHRFATLEGVSA